MRLLITGVNRGIGKVLTEQALAEGHQVIGTARKAADFSYLKDTLGFTGLELDVTVPESLQKFSQQLRQSTSEIDVLINNAGVLLDSGVSFDDLTAEKIQQTFAVNVLGPHLVTQIAKPFLEKSKTPKVLSITSLMGSISDNSSGKYYAYRMSKTALNMWNKSFSIDHPKFAALVIHPGWVQTDMGGQQAPLQAKDSAAGILKLAEEASISSTGKFLDYRGREISW